MEPNFHDLYLKGDLKLELSRQEPENTCMDFTEDNEKLMWGLQLTVDSNIPQFESIFIKLIFRIPWEKAEIFDRSIRTFKATIGPSGGKKGYQGITGL